MGLLDGVLVIVFGVWPAAALLAALFLRVVDADWHPVPGLALVLSAAVLEAVALTAAVDAIFG